MLGMVVGAAVVIVWIQWIVIVAIAISSHFQESAVVVVVAIALNHRGCNSRQRARQRCRRSLRQDLHGRSNPE